MSDTADILEYMKTGRTISQRVATERFGCTRLAARIADIKRLGFDVKGEMQYRYAQDGKLTSKWKEYWL